MSSFVCSDVAFFTGALVEQLSSHVLCSDDLNSFRSQSIVGASSNEKRFTVALLEQIGE